MGIVKGLSFSQEFKVNLTPVTTMDRHIASIEKVGLVILLGEKTI